MRKAGHSRLGWTDPKVVSGVLVWLVFAGLLHARFRPEMRGRRVMLFTVVAFLCLAFATVGVDLLHITSHGVPGSEDSGLGLRTRVSHSAGLPADRPGPALRGVAGRVLSPPESSVPPKGGGVVKLLALGVDHRTAPAPVREALAFEGPRRDEGLDALASAFPGGEFVVLSTCNRVEVYAAGDAAAIPTTGALIDFLAHFHARPAETSPRTWSTTTTAEAVSHLFKVAASLESLVLGEGQILGQVRDAYKAAVARKAVGPILHAVFPHALRVGKLVREQTGMDKGKLSVASVAVDVARDVFDTFGDKTVLVIGAGKMGDLTLQHLSTLRPGSILVTNRNPERAEAAAAPMGRQGRPVRAARSALVEADVVVSTTAADRPIVDLATYARVQKARKNRLALILDIAIPRDFDPRIGDLEQVMLYNVDDLRAQAEQNRQRRPEGGRPGPGDHRARDRSLPGRAPPPDPRRRRPPPARRLRRRRPAPRVRGPDRPPARPHPGPARRHRPRPPEAPEPVPPPPPSRPPDRRLRRARPSTPTRSLHAVKALFGLQ